MKTFHYNVPLILVGLLCSWARPSLASPADLGHDETQRSPADNTRYLQQGIIATRYLQVGKKGRRSSTFGKKSNMMSMAGKKGTMSPSVAPSMTPSTNPSLSVQPSISLQPSSAPSAAPSLSMSPTRVGCITTDSSEKLKEFCQNNNCCNGGTCGISGTVTVCRDSCNGPRDTCSTLEADSEVGIGSCNGNGQVLPMCEILRRGASIGDGSCNGLEGVCQRLGVEARVGSMSCSLANSSDKCFLGDGASIGDESCNGKGMCALRNGASIGNSSCNVRTCISAEVGVSVGDCVCNTISNQCVFPDDDIPGSCT